MMRLRAHHLLSAILLALALMLAATPALADVSPDEMRERVVEGAPMRFHYPARFERAIDELEGQAKLSMFKVIGTLGIREMPMVDVWVLPELDDYFELRGEPNRAPPWAVGLSLSNQHTILVLHGLGPNRQPVHTLGTFTHELAHVGMDVARAGNYVPLWFNEGVAEELAGEWTLERGEHVARMASLGKLLEFRYLSTSYPPHSNRVSLAYSQSTHFVRQMRQLYGKQVIAKIMNRVAAGEHFPQAFEAVTGDSLHAAEERWAHELADGSTPWSAFADGNMLFFGAALIFLLAFVVKRRRSARKLADMARDEASHADGWDYDPAQYHLPGQPKLYS